LDPGFADTHPSMIEALKESGDALERGFQTLIARANANGGVDDITVVLVQFLE
jgi:serine/threonine protein phosphatase PrpC